MSNSDDRYIAGDWYEPTNNIKFIANDLKIVYDLHKNYGMGDYVEKYDEKSKDYTKVNFAELKDDFKDITKENSIVKNLNDILKDQLTRKTIDDINANEPLKESLDILKESKANQKAINELKNKIEAQKAQEQTQDKEPAKEELEKQYNTPLKRMNFTKNTIDSIEANEPLKESLDILKESKANQKAIDELKSKIEAQKAQGQDSGEQNNKESQKSSKNNANELSEEQKTYNKKEDDLLKRHEAELEILEDKQNKIQAQFEKSIENLSNAKDVGSMIDFLKQIDNAIVLTLDHAEASKEIQQKQLQEKMQLAFENPKMKEVVGDLVKEIYNGKNQLEKSYDEMKKMEKSYEELNKGIVKNGGRDLEQKELDKFEKQFENIKKASPKFENTYPNTCKKANDIIKNGKEKIKNKSHEQGSQRDINYY